MRGGVVKISSRDIWLLKYRLTRGCAAALSGAASRGGGGGIQGEALSPAPLAVYVTLYASPPMRTEADNPAAAATGTDGGSGSGGGGPSVRMVMMMSACVAVLCTGCMNASRGGCGDI